MFEGVDESLYKKIAEYFPECPDVHENVANLNSINPSVIKEIRILLNELIPVEDRIAAKERAMKIETPFGDDALTKEEQEFYFALLEKLNFTHITPNTIPKMFSHISSRLPKDSEDLPDEVINLFKFMEAIAAAVPDMFCDCYLQLKTMLSDENEIIVDSALAILSHTAQVLTKKSFSKFVYYSKIDIL